MTEKNAPRLITCRNGKKAKLVEPPYWDAENNSWFVLYELLDNEWRFVLFWPEMTYRGEPHGFDAMDVKIG